VLFALLDAVKDMVDPHPLAFLDIPTGLLVALDNRPFRFALQPYHHLVRMAHILSMAAFFGAVVLLDLRLMGVRSALALRAMAAPVLTFLYVTFALTVVTGAALFFYDPVHVGSHAYFAPKLILIALGFANAVIFHRTGFITALATESGTSMSARWAGALSLLFWSGVMIAACLNVEAAPKLLLR